MEGAGLLWLQAESAAPDYSFFIMLSLIFLIFYVLVLRPQNKRQRDHETALKGIEPGDAVVSAGGIHGKVTGVADDVLTVEIASLKGGDKVRVKMARARVDSVTKAAAKALTKAKGGDDS